MEYKLLLGEILIKRNRINQDQLNQALELQKKEKIFLGEILVNLGYVDDKDIVVALVIQCDLPYIAINKYNVDPSILKFIPKDVAIKERVVPLDKIGEVLSVVMINPLSEEKKKYLEVLTKCRIATFICTKSEIQEAIARFYR